MRDFFRGGPFRVGFLAALGVLLALVIGSAVVTVGDALALVFVSFFVALGLYPVVRWLESAGVRAGVAVMIVAVVFLALVVLLVTLIVPVVRDQAYPLLASLPAQFRHLVGQEWFISLDGSLGGVLTGAADWILQTVADPGFWLAVGGGALHLGAGFVGIVFGVVFVVVLTLYFVVGLPSIKQALYALVPRSKRTRTRELGEEIAESVGKYLGGMTILAALNALFTFLLLTVLGVPYAPLLAVVALPLTLVPLVGSVISTALITVVALFTSPAMGAIALVVMVAYMQVEAYVLTPRIVSRAIKIPAYLVLIGAVVGGTLLGLLGVLIACPVIASILLISRTVLIPRQEAL